MSIAHVKSIVAAALIGVAALTTVVEPAAAGQWHGGGGWRAGGWGGGGWHGGGWGGGGWHGGGWGARPGVGWRSAGVWRGGGWGRPSYGWGGGWGGGGWGWGAPLLAGGLLAGAAIAATQPYYPANNCNQLQPVYDGYGNYLGQQWINVCR